MTTNKPSLAGGVSLHAASWSALLLLAASLVPLAGCGKTPLRPAAALRSPSGSNDGSAMLYNAPAPHPLVVISLPNTPHGKPHVDTVLSVLAPHQATTATTLPPPPVEPSTVMQVHEELVPATQPATPRATTRPTTAPATQPVATNQNATDHAVVPARGQ
ncbi:MAG: hypothetical protein ACP5VQ_05230 [Phycisphaerae bacterium]